MVGRLRRTRTGIRERDSERPLLRIVLRVSGALNRSVVDPLLWGGMPKVLGFHLLLITFITTRWLTYRTYHRGIKKTDIHLNSWFNLTCLPTEWAYAILHDVLWIDFAATLFNEALRSPNHKTCFSFAQGSVYRTCTSFPFIFAHSAQTSLKASLKNAAEKSFHKTSSNATWLNLVGVVALVSFYFAMGRL